MQRFLAVSVLLFIPSLSFAAVGFLKGEQDSGLNKICFYEGARGSFTKTVRASQICPIRADDGGGYSGAAPSVNDNLYRSSGSVGFLTGEQSSGLNKTCFYDSARGTFTKTVRASRICPIRANQ